MNHTKEQFEQLLEKATQSGLKKFNQLVAEFDANPKYVVQEHKDMLDDSSPVVKSYALPELCGYVTMRTGGNDPLAKAFRKFGDKLTDDWSEKITYKIGDWRGGKAYGGGYSYSYWGKLGQGIDSKTAFYNEVERILSDAGFGAWLQSRLD